MGKYVAMAVFTLLAGAVASAAPIIDGVVSSGEYSLTHFDALDEPNLGTAALDISTVRFDLDADFLYVALTTQSSPIARDGGPTSVVGETIFTMVFFDYAGTSLSRELEVRIRPTREMVMLMDDDFSFVPLTSADYALKVVDALELKISRTALNLGDFSYAIMLSDTGPAADDVLLGQVRLSELPEPATLAMLGLGATGLLLRRRRA